MCPICSYDFVVGLRLGPRVSLYFCLDKCTICLDHLANLFICISYNFLIFVSSTNFSTLLDISSSMIPFKRGQGISPLGLDNTLLARTIPPIGSRHCQDLLLTTSHRHPEGGNCPGTGFFFFFRSCLVSRLLTSCAKYIIQYIC